MFDLTTILTLIAPAVIGPLGCVAVLKAITRAEAAREPDRAAEPTTLVLERPAASVQAEATPARHVA